MAHREHEALRRVPITALSELTADDVALHCSSIGTVTGTRRTRGILDVTADVAATIPSGHSYTISETSTRGYRRGQKRRIDYPGCRIYYRRKLGNGYVRLYVRTDAG